MAPVTLTSLDYGLWPMSPNWTILLYPCSPSVHSQKSTLVTHATFLHRNCQWRLPTCFWHSPSPYNVLHFSTGLALLSSGNIFYSHPFLSQQSGYPGLLAVFQKHGTACPQIPPPTQLSTLSFEKSQLHTNARPPLSASPALFASTTYDMIHYMYFTYSLIVCLCSIECKFC